MDPNRWENVQAAFDELVELDPPSRAERLAALGTVDPGLREALERLLAADEGVDALLESIESPLLSPPPPPVDPFALSGGTLSHFRVIEPLGAGGMGVVYRAEDVRLGRAVALKIPLPQYALDATARHRFFREARAAAALDHPNLCTIHEVGESEDGRLFLAMTLYHGETLKARLAREGRLPASEALSIARQVARGLACAHTRGITHRDLKPANLMLLPDGTVKILDFGLARVADLTLTGAGATMGTVAYMSPEQIRGEEITARTDLWALGVVLYEMLTGMRPFRSDHDLSVAHAILHADPAPAEGIPSGVGNVLSRLLEKDPTRRYPSSSELVVQLDGVSVSESRDSPRPSSEPSIATDRARAGWRWAMLAVGVPALVAGGLLLWREMAGPEGPPTALRRQLTFSGNALFSSLSPDGDFLAYMAQVGDSQRVVVQDLAGGPPDTIATLFLGETLEWSPDGSTLLISEFNGADRSRATFIPRGGGPGRGLSIPMHALLDWLPDGRVSMYNAASRSISIVDVQTGESSSVPIDADYTFLLEGGWSRDGRRFAVASERSDPVRYAIQVVGVEGGTVTLVEDSVPLSSPNWASGGEALYYARGTEAIWRVELGTDGRARGEPEVVHQQLDISPYLIQRLRFSSTGDGRSMTYAKGRHFSNLVVVEPGAAQSRSLPTELTSGTALRWSPAVSPDGRWIAFGQEADGVAELYRMPIEGGAARQITHGARVRPRSRIAWSPDGTRLAFESVRAARAQLWIATLPDGDLRPLEDTRASTVASHITWSPGPWITYQTPDQGALLRVDPTSGDIRPLLPDSVGGGFFSPVWAPDSQRIAFTWSRGPDGPGVWIFDRRDGSRRQVADWYWLFGWSADGRYLYAQKLVGPTLYSIDSRGVFAPAPVATIPGVREADCTPGGPYRPGAFVCAAFDVVSDIWLVETPGTAGPS